MWKLRSSNIKLCSYFLPNRSLTITLNFFPEPHLLIQSHNLWISCLRHKHSLSALHILHDIYFLLLCSWYLNSSSCFSRHQFPVSGCLLVLLGSQGQVLKMGSLHIFLLPAVVSYNSKTELNKTKQWEKRNLSRREGIQFLTPDVIFKIDMLKHCIISLC